MNKGWTDVCGNFKNLVDARGQNLFARIDLSRLNLVFQRIFCLSRLSRFISWIILAANHKTYASRWTSNSKNSVSSRFIQANHNAIRTYTHMTITMQYAYRPMIKTRCRSHKDHSLCYTFSTKMVTPSSQASITTQISKKASEPNA